MPGTGLWHAAIHQEARAIVGDHQPNPIADPAASKHYSVCASRPCVRDKLQHHRFKVGGVGAHKSGWYGYLRVDLQTGGRANDGLEKGSGIGQLGTDIQQARLLPNLLREQPGRQFTTPHGGGGQGAQQLVSFRSGKLLDQQMLDGGDHGEQVAKIMNNLSRRILAR
ncbi:hypothetical protein IZV00_17570 [Sphingobium sp. Cam5-1]|nr:hypothetical protein [Sphingobium sp. Cam5-1]QPI74684.1 hypothetical protein IZV00_17570 [Sphingobium sp. Cam5-1]